jgi:spermidine synthase
MKSVRTIVFLLFGLSGACGLVYEIAWSKYLSLFMGSTAYSHMIVLATFMGGLALGSWYWGRRADRTPDPLRLYGLLELAIGVYGILYPLLMVLLEEAFLGSLRSLGLTSDAPAVLFLKLTLSALSLIIPTFCMGGTLPLLLKLVTKSAEEAGMRVATLYWINSAGAVVGAATAGFLLIRIYSLDTAIWITAAASIGGGIAAIVVARAARTAAPGDRSQPAGTRAEAGSNADRFPPSIVTLALATATVSGFISMIYEVAWIRLLSTILGSSTYSFTLMLIAFISGIASGGWIVGRMLRRRRNLLRLLALCQIGAAVAMLATMPFYERLPYFLWKLSKAIPPTADQFGVFLLLEFLFCLALMWIPTTLSGMSLPISGRIATAEVNVLGRSIGNVFSLNTVGAVAGTLIAGLVLIPFLGVKSALEAGIAANAVLGLFLLSRDRRTTAGWKIAGIAVVAGLAVVYLTAFPEWNKNVSNLGVYRVLHQEVPESYANFLEMSHNRTILWYDEGVTANVAVASYQRDGKTEKSLIINGKADASTGYDMGTQVLLAHTPLLLGPDTGSVLVIGLGSGITAGSALTHPIRSLDCVEISPEVLKCNYFFTKENGNFLADPRVRMVIDDAITFVKSNDRKYSCIVSEPSNPWIAGIGNLFTSEFFELCKSRLTPNGVLAQWFHTYDVNDEVFQLVLRTISRSFDHVSVWVTGSSDAILVASMAPIPTDFPAMERKFNRPSVRSDLGRIGIPDLPTFLSTQLAGGVRTSVELPDGPVNTEKRPVLEFLAPISFFSHSSVGYTAAIDRRLDKTDTSLYLSAYRSRTTISPVQLFNIAEYQATTSDEFRIAYRFLAEGLERDPADERGLTLYANIAAEVENRDQELWALKGLVRLRPDDVNLLVYFANVHRAWLNGERADTSADQIGESIPMLRHCIEVTGGNDERCWLSLAGALAALGKYRDAGGAYSRVMTLRESYEVLDSTATTEGIAVLAAESYLNAGDIPNAETMVARLKSFDPASTEVAALEGKLRASKK